MSTILRNRFVRATLNCLTQCEGYIVEGRGWSITRSQACLHKAANLWVRKRTRRSAEFPSSANVWHGCAVSVDGLRDAEAVKEFNAPRRVLESGRSRGPVRRAYIHYLCTGWPLGRSTVRTVKCRQKAARKTKILPSSKTKERKRRTVKEPRVGCSEWNMERLRMRSLALSRILTQAFGCCTTCLCIGPGTLLFLKQALYKSCHSRGIYL
jgi:hypothetical protein